MFCTEALTHGFGSFFCKRIHATLVIFSNVSSWSKKAHPALLTLDELLVIFLLSRFSPAGTANMHGHKTHRASTVSFFEPFVFPILTGDALHGDPILFIDFATNKTFEIAMLFDDIGISLFGGDDIIASGRSTNFVFVAATTLIFLCTIACQLLCLVILSFLFTTSILITVLLFIGRYFLFIIAKPVSVFITSIDTTGRTRIRAYHRRTESMSPRQLFPLHSASIFLHGTLDHELTTFGTASIKKWMHCMHADIITAEEAMGGTLFL
mmetsp:Transcript_113/g.209  ORF Transcript_113/g.209 Transcript_113/m.209 type:complete len:267 (-) Transcript_113:383-1183(-)